MRLRVALLVAILALPAALAHPGDEYDWLEGVSGDVGVFVSPQTLVVKAGREVAFLGEAFQNATRLPLREATYDVFARGPDGEVQARVAPLGNGFNASLAFPSRGAWELVVVANGTEVPVSITVYPPSGVHVESSALRYGFFYAGRESRADLALVQDADGAHAAASAAIARIERLDNESVLDARDVMLVPGASPGELALVHTFERAGTHRVWLSSAAHGVAVGDLPPFRVRVLAPQAEEPPARETPLGGLAALALVGAAMLIGRR